MQFRNATLAAARRLAALALVLTVFAVAPRAENAHPQDGPHIDLRLQIAEDAIHVRTTINLAFADELIGVVRENLETIHPVEWPALRAGLERRFGELNWVEVDGERLSPTLAAFDVGEPDPALMGLFPVYGARALIQIRFELEYAIPAPSEGGPAEVTIGWGAFPKDTTERRMGIEAPREVLARLAAGGLDSVITLVEGGEPFTWSSSGSGAADHLLPIPEFAAPPSYDVPILSLGLLSLALLLAIVFLARAAGGAPGTAKRFGIVAVILAATVVTRDVGRYTVQGEGDVEPGETYAASVFEALHSNVYRAFDFTDESDVYDALALSVEGELLEELYAEIYASLVQEEAAGAVGSVQGLERVETNVHRLDVASGEARNFAVDARWKVEGAVFHWGHAHWRVEELAGSYDVENTPEGWRIASGQITEQVLISASQDRPGEDVGDDFVMPEEL